MKNYTVSKLTMLVVLLTISYSATATGGVIVVNGGREQPQEEAVLFACDNHSIPLIYGLELGSVTGRKHADNPVLRVGKSGEVDAKAVAYYGVNRNIHYALRQISNSVSPVHTTDVEPGHALQVRRNKLLIAGRIRPGGMVDSISMLVNFHNLASQIGKLTRTHLINHNKSKSGLILAGRGCK